MSSLNIKQITPTSNIVSETMASSALTGKIEADVEIKSSPGQFHEMFAHKPHHVHHTCYDKIQGCDLLEGEWGKVGTIISWRYVHDGKAKVSKQLVEAIDPSKNLITFREIEGDQLKEYKSFVATLQASPKNKGSGSIVHWTVEYEKLHHGIAHPETLLQFLVDASKDIDAHLTQPN
ncbi:hypothetical protein ERO13_A03G119900v2 [Gossypium hirsutum]|uniref:MLP-like protein 43 n=7 Tax=Gossypium TaxID=3633 RepID=A0A1U8HHU5_GOSHI|nr:MLP-like protein 43 [Gossypium hirsutum]XP_017616728.2 MLP-like protein 43 [Gossypium arboreum]KAG4208263.1 hypothetical protein ERO13_A03G119900v2 [Gossypium hirsutum]TYH25194.1 hypothetical protein ES288_A03G149900v1 [Gossypium darwinii]TYI36518.1 hypothetical protein ES332_A03G147500v1 [Gossypium tomentosum]